jgi:hypothetical protein
MKSQFDIFINFLRGVAASSQLLNLAKQKGCFIESICLSASIIDASLRIGLILKYQLDNKTSDILGELLFQSDEDKIISERKIYKKSYDAGIIDKLTYDKLELLYKKRNKVVHRYIISELTTDGIILIAKDYEDIIDKIRSELYELESKQILEKTGMTVSGEIVPDNEKRKSEHSIDEMIRIKHGNDYLDKKLKEIFDKK